MDLIAKEILGLGGRLDAVRGRSGGMRPVLGPAFARAGFEKQVTDAGNTWADKGAYDQTARKLTRRFEVNFKQFGSYVSDEVKAAGIYSAA